VTTSSTTTTPITRRSGGPTPRTTVRRLPERGHYDAAAIHAILDAAFVCHVGFVDAGQPFVIPTAFARIGERLAIHGSAASRMLKALATGAPACVTVTLVDGLVLARSAFHHSINYRSVVVVGSATEITEPGEKSRALDAIVEHIVPGRLADVRAPTENELRATRAVWFPLDEASAKLRTGPPKDDDEDYALSVWAGELPLRLTPQPPVADPRLPVGIPLPEHVSGWPRGARRP
jgi:nitroimidazol reductase NimA-like FMN-containing flavoprotein (pyridoxamine 5'-phosphate oxidase superfamily)